MIESLVLLLIGAFIGWHFPQPKWAVSLETKIKSLFAK
jgi:hypothetical protein